MVMTRRELLKVSGATAGVAFAGLYGMNVAQAKAEESLSRIRYAQQTTTICPYCAVGCGQIVSTSDRKVVNVEGDPDHPINEGSLCSKGSALYQIANNDRRMTDVLYRAPGSGRWETRSWDWSMNRIAQLTKETRDADLNAKIEAGAKDLTRVDSIAALGGAALDNEECYLYSKFMRALGVAYIEHQARI